MAHKEFIAENAEETIRKAIRKANNNIRVIREEYASSVSPTYINKGGVVSISIPRTRKLQQ